MGYRLKRKVTVPVVGTEADAPQTPYAGRTTTEP
jgi:hypothetical protein